MASHRQTALDCSVRIVNTKLMQGLFPEGTSISGEIKTMADFFADWLGPEPVKQAFGKAPKPTHPTPCPICKGEMEDQRQTKKSPSAPDARCKNRGRWNDDEKKFDGCQGVIWPADK